MNLTQEHLDNLNLKQDAYLKKTVERMTEKPKPSKFKNKRCEHEGIKFQSMLERRHYIRLLGDTNVKNIELQKRYDFIVNGTKLKTFYKADFRVEYQDGTVAVIDSKGRETSDFKIKKQLMKACHGIEVILWTK